MIYVLFMFPSSKSLLKILLSKQSVPYGSSRCNSSICQTNTFLMKNLSFVLLMIFGLFVGMPAAEAVVRPVNPENTVEKVETKELTKKEARKQRRMERKAKKKQLKQAIRDWKKEGASDTDTLLLVILAILIPPLAVGIYEGGLTNRFWISLLLTLLFFLPGMIYALIVILE